MVENLRVVHSGKFVLVTFRKESTFDGTFRKESTFYGTFRKKSDSGAVTFFAECAIKSTFWSECAIKSTFWSECYRYKFCGMYHPVNYGIMYQKKSNLKNNLPFFAY